MLILITMIIILFIALFIEGIKQNTNDRYDEGYNAGCRDTLQGIREDMENIL